MHQRPVEIPALCRAVAVAFIALLLAPATSVQADDENPRFATEEWSLSRLRAPEVVNGPIINTPADFQHMIEDSDAGMVWDNIGATEGDWIRFEEGPGGRFALPSDVLMEVLQTVHADIFESFEHTTIEPRTDRLVMMGRPEHLKDVRKTYEWAVGGLAPSVSVNAAYDVARPEPRALAAGQARLFPGRWTRVYLQRAEQPFCIDFNIELAQRSTAMDPVMMALPEGQELYMRLHPGESVSLVEVWSGEVEHTEQRSIDLSVIRNVPEANAPGKVTFPVSRLLRAHTVLLLPNGQASEHVVSFGQSGRDARLRLSFAAPPAAHPATETGRPRPLALLRMDAVAGSLDFGVRENEGDAWIERMASAAIARGFEDDDLQMQSVSASGCVFAEGLPRALEYVRASIGAAEARMQQRRASIRVLSLAEPTYRKGVEAKAIAIGKAISSEYLSGLRSQGAEAVGRAELPLLLGVEAGFRVGFSEPGLADFNVEVAQESAGMDPVTTAYFRGLSGLLRAERRGSETVLSFRGALSFADPAASTIDLAFRPPVSMDLQHNAWKAEPDARRVVKLDAIGGASSQIDAEATLSATGAEHVLAIVVRGGEAHLVLGSLSR